MKDKFMRFMYGRYGVDSFSKFLVIAGIILLALSGFFEYGWILYLLSLVLGVFLCSHEWLWGKE